jgi:galactokinase
MEPVEHLRDISPEALEVAPDSIYEALKTIPAWMRREEVRTTLADQSEQVETWFASHRDLEGGYPLRAVLLYGIAECERSRRALEAFRNGDAEQIGRLFAVSHDGDRVSRRSASGLRGARKIDVDDAFLDRLIGLARSDDLPERERAALAWQPGAYGCSTPEIDEMVDIAMATEGVLGAQLVGAGLGGSIVVLVHGGAVEALRQALEVGYYGPRGLEPGIYVFQPVERARCFEI